MKLSGRILELIKEHYDLEEGQIFRISNEKYNIFNGELFILRGVIWEECESLNLTDIDHSIENERKVMYKVRDKVVCGNIKHGYKIYYINSITKDCLDKIWYYVGDNKMVGNSCIDHEATKTVQKCSDDELRIMKYIDKEYNWIAKNEREGRNEALILFEKEPAKTSCGDSCNCEEWESVGLEKELPLEDNSFESIQWYNSEPVKIVRLENI
ncbi:hypothetical protein [Peptostreptococcus faecalis]|uniref:hypothetical protein n=1 Tax=Peptostreptococcus faecalis TaxID=2045015 RepID=UPI000C7C0FFB|nr:hypothetical protein [Peptostreptococcus faecalis]